MNSLYDLTLNPILSNRDIDISSKKLPKMLHRKIGRSMKIYNEVYFEKICDDFQLFCHLLESNSLSELFLIRFFQTNPNSVMKLVDIYTETDEGCVEFGLLLGNVLKYSGFLNESEKVLIRAWDRCENKSVSLEILRELLHVQTLLNKKSEAEQTYELLLKCIRHEKKTLSNIYMSLASFELIRGNISNAREWNDQACKYIRKNKHLSVRNKFEIYLNRIKIRRLLGLDIGYYYKKTKKLINVSQDSLLQFYKAKLEREYILYYGERCKEEANFPFYKILFVATVSMKYEKILGCNHVLTMKVRKEFHDFKFNERNSTKV